MRTTWNGSISFGLVNIPVGLAPATASSARQSDVSFRLLHREWLTSDGPAFHATEHARVKAEFAARGLVHFLFRDRFFFDVGKLLDVTIVREDPFHDR